MAPATPVASTPPAPAAPALPPPLALSDDWHVRLEPYAAVGSVSELGVAAPLSSELQAQVYVTAGAAVALTWKGLIIEGSFGDSFYRSTYVTTALATDGSGLAALESAEQKIDVNLIIGYELVHHMDPEVAKKFTLTLFVGGGTELILNNLAPTTSVGPEGGARIGIAVSDSLVLGLGYSFLPNLLPYSGVSLLLGTPKYIHNMDVDLSLRLVGAARVRLAYLSEIVTTTSEYRFYQGLGVGLDYGF